MHERIQNAITYEPYYSHLDLLTRLTRNPKREEIQEELLLEKKAKNR